MQGAEPSRSEMCVAFLYYYPASNLDYCYSMPVWASYQQLGNFVRNYLNFKPSAAR